MKQSFVSKLACPFDKSDLALKIFKEENKQILEGILICNDCRRYYPIIHGIPVMSPDEYREVSLEMPLIQKWGEALLIENGLPTFQLATEKQLGD